MRSQGLLIAVVAALCALPGAAWAAGGLPDVASGARPGPDALYEPAASSPLLENVAPWKAGPILVSGAQSYRDGDWVYQDFLYDDHGGAGSPANNNPVGAGAFLFSPAAGTYTYPTNPVYANNAGDLVELRARPLADATAFRVTLNTLKDPNRVAFTIALGGTDASRDWPHGAGVSSPAELFLTVHGTTAELVDAASGAAKTPGPSATVDVTRRQFDVRVPHAAWDPGQAKVRTTIGVGLWDPQANQYLAPQGGDAGEDTPGGAAPSGAAIVNAGPRFNEPLPDPTQFGGGATLGDAAVGGTVQAAWWRERAQADALRSGDLSPFHAEVDFGKLAAGTDDDSGVPKTGVLNRILVSRHDLGQGLDPTKVCFDLGSGFDAGSKCVGRFVGALQPYSLYVPVGPLPKQGYGMTLLLHSLSANYNQYSASNNQNQLGERGAGSLVLTPSGRGPDGFYAGIAEADTFEAWGDVARHYPLDADWSVVSGYSMGGFGTFRLLARWPDLFARGMSTVGVPGTVDDQLPSLRNTPIMTWNADADELVMLNRSEQMVTDMTATGLRFIHWLFGGSDHLTLATNDEYLPAATFLGSHRVDRNPPHVTYVVDPTEDNADAATIADHAYWVSGLAARDPKAAQRGTIDARSEAFGEGDPKVLPVKSGSATLDGGAHGPMPYTMREQAWEDPPSAAKADRLVVKAKNLASATIDTQRAGLTCAPQLDVTSDGPLDLRLACPALKTKRCASVVTLSLPRIRGQRITRVVLTRRGHRVKTVRARRGRTIRRVAVRRVSRKAFSLRVHLRTNARGKKARRLTLVRRISAC